MFIGFSASEHIAITGVIQGPPFLREWYPLLLGLRDGADQPDQQQGAHVREHHHFQSAGDVGEMGLRERQLRSQLWGDMQHEQGVLSEQGFSEQWAGGSVSRGVLSEKDIQHSRI